MENLAIDNNMRNTLGAVTNDGSQTIKRVRVNPITGALIVEMNITSSNTMIGSSIPGGTAGSVLFLDVGGTLAQDNANFFYDPVNHFLGLGNNTPAATLDIDGTLIVTGDAGTADELLGRETSTGSVSGVTVGTGLTLDGNVLSATASGSGITSINSDTTAAQTLSNTDTFITINDIGGGAHTFNIDIANLTSDSTFISDIATSLLADTTFLTDLADNSTFYTELANNTSFISDLTSNATFQSDLTTIINNDTDLEIDLTSQVTGILPVPNGGTGVNTFTAYAPVFGGTTSTDPLQSGTVGTAGQVLTSNGAGAIATFQNLPNNGGLSSAADILIDSGVSYTGYYNPGSYDSVSGRYYVPGTTAGSGNQQAAQTFNVYIKNPYNSWTLEQVITPVRSQGGSGAFVFGICNDGTYLYMMIQYNISTTNYVDMVRYNTDGTGGIATNLLSFPVTGGSTGQYSPYRGNSNVPCNALGLNGTLLYAKVNFWNSGSGAFDITNVIPFTISSTTYTPGTTITFSGITPFEENSVQTSDNITFYFGGLTNILKYTLSGNIFTYISTTNYSQIARGQNASGAGSYILDLIDNSTYFTIVYQTLYSYTNNANEEGNYERTVRNDSYIKP